MDSFIETFHIDWKTIIAQGVNFILVLFVLNFLVLKPLKKVMKEREEKIISGLENAKLNEEIVSKTKIEYDNVIKNAKIEAHNIFQEGKKDAEKRRLETLENTKLEVEKMIQEGKKSLEIEKSKMINEAKTEIVSLVVKATEKILETQESGNIGKELNNIKNTK
jgi:F-type H+-transporting ATPase subunit b